MGLPIAVLVVGIVVYILWDKYSTLVQWLRGLAHKERNASAREKTLANALDALNETLKEAREEAEKFKRLSQALAEANTAQHEAFLSAKVSPLFHEILTDFPEQPRGFLTPPYPEQKKA